MKRILLVEDDRILGENLSQKLSTEFDVTWATSKAEALKALQNHKWDLLVLDLGLPDGSGFDIAREVPKRLMASERPAFLFLTAQSDAETRLQGYELGASEFVPKPFHLKELLIRIRHALETRPQKFEIQLDDVTINLTDLSIRSSEGGIQYPSVSDMKILKFLIEQSPRPVSRDEIIDHVWGVDKDLSHRTIDNAIVRLRQMLGSEGEQVIRSVRSVGYQWSREEKTP